MQAFSYGHESKYLVIQVGDLTLHQGADEYDLPK